METKLSDFERPEDVQFYSAHARELLQSQQHKIRKFLQHRCIEYVGNNTFICKEIPGYNKTCYKLTKLLSGDFDCNCQGYMTRYNRGDKRPFCSHLGALYEYFARGRKYE